MLIYVIIAFEMETSMKITWKDYRKNQKYVTNAAIADLVAPGMNYRTDYKPTFTAKPYHHDGLYSLEQLFLDHYMDPTEYSFVEDVFEGDFKHWERFKTSQWIQPLYENWKKKAEAKLMSEAMNKIVTIAFDENNKSCFQALKYLVERKPKEKVGRPKKEKEEDKGDDKVLLEAIKRIQE